MLAQAPACSPSAAGGLLDLLAEAGVIDWLPDIGSNLREGKASESSALEDECKRQNCLYFHIN
jgi:hypothetical protein